MKVIVIPAEGESGYDSQSITFALTNGGYTVEELQILDTSDPDHTLHTPQCAAINEALHHTADELESTTRQLHQTTGQLESTSLQFADVTQELQEALEYIGISGEDVAVRRLAYVFCDMFDLSMIDGQDGAVQKAKEFIESGWLESHEIAIAEAALRERIRETTAGELVEEIQAGGLGWPHDLAGQAVRS